MAPDGSVFEVNRSTKIPQLVSNVEAVQTLTHGIDYLRIAYDNRRQVFVEGKNDVLYFTKLYNLLSRRHVFTFKPVFLEPHSNNANCTDVIRIVKQLRESGSDLAYGLIDFDLVNFSRNPVFVLGNGNRYSIENYILDPLLVGLVLIRHNKALFTDLGVKEKYTYMDARNLTTQECQQIINNVLQRSSIPLIDMSAAILENGFEVQYPKAFLLEQGHQYEKKLIASIPELGAVKRGQGDSALKLAFLQVIEELPEFLARDVASSFFEILGSGANAHPKATNNDARAAPETTLPV